MFGLPQRLLSPGSASAPPSPRLAPPRPRPRSAPHAARGRQRARAPTVSVPAPAESSVHWKGRSLSVPSPRSSRRLFVTAKTNSPPVVFWTSFMGLLAVLFIQSLIRLVNIERLLCTGPGIGYRMNQTARSLPPFISLCPFLEY